MDTVNVMKRMFVFSHVQTILKVLTVKYARTRIMENQSMEAYVNVSFNSNLD